MHRDLLHRHRQFERHRPRAISFRNETRSAGTSAAQNTEKLKTEKLKLFQSFSFSECQRFVREATREPSSLLCLCVGEDNLILRGELSGKTRSTPSP